jgi:hypothetical protein
MIAANGLVVKTLPSRRITLFFFADVALKFLSHNHSQELK